MGAAVELGTSQMPHHRSTPCHERGTGDRGAVAVDGTPAATVSVRPPGAEGGGCGGGHLGTAGDGQP